MDTEPPHLEHVPIVAMAPERFAEVLSEREFEALTDLIFQASRELYGRVIWSRRAEEPRRGAWPDRVGGDVEAAPGRREPDRRDPRSGRGRTLGTAHPNPRDLRGAGRAIAGLLADPARAGQIGIAAQNRVRQHFLAPHHLGRYFEVIRRIVARRRHEPA
jgi:hypothetical protein